MSLFLALLPVLLYALYKIVKTNHEVKTFQASILKKYPPTAETSEQIIKRNLYLELENQEQMKAVARTRESNRKNRTLRPKKFNDRSRGAA